MPAHFLLLLSALWLFRPAAGAQFTVDTVNARFALDGRNFVPIVTSHQLLSDFAFWKDMGCNTVTYIESPNTWAQWTAALDANQLYGLPYGSGQLTQRHDRSLGYYLIGEPDISKDGNPPPNTPAASVCAAAAAARRSADGQAYYRTCSQAVDFVVHDHYPLMEDGSLENGIEITAATKRLIQYVDGKKPVGVFIETGQIDDVNRGPSPGEFEAEVWTAIGAGAKAIFYFPVRPSPWLRNNLKGNTAMENKLRAVNALITQLTDVIAEDPVTVTGIARRFLTRSIMLNQYYRRLGSDLYLLAVATRAETTSYALDFAWNGSAQIEVVGEGRTVNYAAGGIMDRFTANKTVHIYKLPGYFTAGIGPQGAIALADQVLISCCTHGPDPRVTIDLPQARPVAWTLYAADGRAMARAPQCPAAGRQMIVPVPPPLPDGIYVLDLTIGATTHRLRLVRTQ
jgi:hypothetical protein